MIQMVFMLNSHLEFLLYVLLMCQMTYPSHPHMTISSAYWTYSEIRFSCMSLYVQQIPRLMISTWVSSSIPPRSSSMVIHFYLLGHLKKLAYQGLVATKRWLCCSCSCCRYFCEHHAAGTSGVEHSTACGLMPRCLRRTFGIPLCWRYFWEHQAATTSAVNLFMAHALTAKCVYWTFRISLCCGYFCKHRCNNLCNQQFHGTRIGCLDLSGGHFEYLPYITMHMFFN